MRQIVIVLAMLFLVSCSSLIKTVEVPVETIKTEYIHDIIIDSIYERDSVDRYIKGDTVFLYREKIKYRYINKVDTILKTDTIPKIVKVKEKEVVEVNHIKWYQEALMWIGSIALLLLIGSIIYKIKIK